MLSNGKVVAVGQGEAVITASVGECTSSVTITVTGEQPGESDLTGVSLDRYTLTLYAGEEAVAQVAAGGDTDVAVNALVGYAGWTPEFSCVLPHRYARLEDLAVDEAVRGEGVGGELLAAAKRWARNRRLEYLELNVLAQNENAIRLYESQDFVEATKVMRCML